jgi:tetratricopeptide (TPR) repeat protein
MNKIVKVVEPRTVRHLLSMHGEAFLNEAYKALLGREPDTEGKAYYLARLRNGKSKLEVIAQLHNSAEGQAYPTSLMGLVDALRRHRQHKIPVLGPILRSAYNRRGDIFDRSEASFDGLDASGTSDAEGQAKSARAGQPSSAQKAQKLTPLEALLSEFGLSKADFPDSLTLAYLNTLNPELSFESVLAAVRVLINQTPPSKIRVFEDDKANASLYTRLGAMHQAAGRTDKANTLYGISLLFHGTADAHEGMGNLSINTHCYHEAMVHYEMALELGAKSESLYANLSRVYAVTGDHKKAVDTALLGLQQIPSSEVLVGRVDDLVNEYWNCESQRLNALASAQDRHRLIDDYDDVASFICTSYARLFKRVSDKPVAVTLNASRVLIIGLTQDAAPQCFRYRMEQKIEQLKAAGYEAEMVAWHDQVTAMRKINFFDIVIFYRVPAFPNVLKQVEYAKSLGKITFFEVDDLLFEAGSVPAFETYGQQITTSSYMNVTKDIGSYRAMARQCDYAIASTQPLLDRLAPLARTGIGYLHRNGFDKHNVFSIVPPADKGYINLFYGSGTLAHNSDFIIEAIPAITKILRKHNHVKLTVVGYLTLPQRFLTEFDKQIIRLPMVRDLGVYWSYLGASDINLAVLHDDVLTGCKSELKWFEAAAFCIPSVVSRTANYVDVIADGKDGYIVAGEEQWYAALNKLVESAELRKRVGTEAHKRVTAEYSVAALATNIDRIIKDCIAKHSALKNNVMAATLNKVAQ